MLSTKGAKKYLVVFIIVQILCFEAVSVDATNNFYKSIREITEDTPNRWQGEYTSARGEIISVDCPISVPNVETMPVMRVNWYAPLDPSFVEFFDTNIEPWSDATSAVFLNKWVALVPQNMGPDDYDYIETFVPLEGVEWDKAYCENNELTLREALDFLENKVEEVYTLFGNAGYYSMEIANGITIARLQDKIGNPLWDSEIYSFKAYELIRGIPILGNTATTYTDLQRFESFYEPKYTFDIQAVDSYSVCANLVAEAECIHDDIPLVDFEKVKPEIEKLIEEGRIRDVHHVSLGYMLYLEPDHNGKYFRLMPSWVIECDYFKSAKVEADLYVDTLNNDNYTQNARYRKLVINAQTGKLLDPENSRSNRSDCPKAITWDKAR